MDAPRNFARAMACLFLIVCCPIPALGDVQQSPSLAELENRPHTASVDEALIAIEVVNVSADGIAQSPRRANGFILRCDGFILGPAALFEFSRTGKSEFADSRKVTVILHPGTPKQQRVEATGPIWRPDGLGFTAFKIKKFHAPALRTLLPDVLKPGDQVTVVSSRYDASSNRYLPIEKRAVLLGKPPGPDEKSAAGAIRFDTPQDELMAGAVVIGPDGMAVGLVPGQNGIGQRKEFVATTVLHFATNCVGAVPTTDAEFNRGAEANGDAAAPAQSSKSHSEMVHVPGGPVDITGSVYGQQPDILGEKISCLPPFDIDKYETTNAEYLEFVRALPEKDQTRKDVYPLGWGRPDSPFPQSVANVPVIGVPLAGAQAYAKWRGKRLPTPYEWLKAAFGPGGQATPPAWMLEFMAFHVATWNEIKARHAQFLKENYAIPAEEYVSEYGVPAGKQELPWIGKSVDSIVGRFSKGVFDAATSAISSRWVDPFYVLSAGSRAFDISPYGAMDMIINASEYYQSTPGRPLFGQTRYFSVDWYWWPRDPVPFGHVPAFLGKHDEHFLLSRLNAINRNHSEYRPDRSFIEKTNILHNLVEASEMTTPWSYWQLDSKSALVSEFPGFWPLLNRTRLDLMPPDPKATRAPNYVAVVRWPELVGGLRLWDSPPKYFHQELGRPLPGITDAINFDIIERSQHPSASGLFRYVLPVGFRCAR